MKAESTKKIRLLTQEERLESLVNDYTTRKQPSLIQMKKGIISRESFLAEARQYVEEYMEVTREEEDELCQMFEQYIFGYSRLSPLIDDPTISDIRVISHDNIRVKREGVRMDGGIAFLSEKEYRQFIDYVATKNQVNISNVNAIQRFTDTESHPDFILRFTVSTKPFLFGQRHCSAFVNDFACVFGCFSETSFF